MRSYLSVELNLSDENICNQLLLLMFVTRNLENSKIKNRNDVSYKLQK